MNFEALASRALLITAAAIVCVVTMGLGGCAGSQTVSDEDAMIDRYVGELREMVAGPEEMPRPKVLLLGIFHFANPGADAHRSKYTFDVFSERGQRELNEVLDRLAEFAPTKILVERGSQQQSGVDEWYQSYLEGKQSTVTNEAVTVGFALAKRLGHARVFGMDARGEWLPGLPETDEAWIAAAKKLGKEDALDDPTDAKYKLMYKHEDDIEETLTLRQRLRMMNHSERVRLGHGVYFFWAGFRVTDGNEFPGPDGFMSMWHNRNLRMFSNIQRLASEPEDRVLVIVGAGHLAILQQCVQSCPTMKWVSVDEYLSPR